MRRGLILTDFHSFFGYLALADKCFYVVVLSQMESAVIASKALVQIYVPNQDGSTSHQYTMDMIFEEDTFHCKLSTSARLINTGKKVSIYLVLDASQIQHLKVCDNKTEVIPSSVTNGFIERAFCNSSEDIVGLQFVLKCHAPLIAPESILKKRPSPCDLAAHRPVSNIQGLRADERNQQRASLGSL